MGCFLSIMLGCNGASTTGPNPPKPKPTLDADGLTLNAVARNENTVVVAGGKWKNTNPSGLNAEIHPIALYSDDDGASWRNVILAETAGFSDIAFGNDRFVATSWNSHWDSNINNFIFSGGIYHSTDGSKWNMAVDSGRTWNRVAFGNNQFLAVGGAGKVLASGEGVQWTSGENLNFDWNDVRGLKFGAGHFIASGTVGKWGHVALSKDGQSWKYIQVGWLHGIGEINYTNNQFIASGTVMVLGSDGKYHAEPYILMSPDGLDWSVNKLSEQIFFNQITYRNGHYFASNQRSIYSTKDLKKWRTTYEIEDKKWRYDLLDLGTHLLSVGFNNILRSAEGENWNSTLSFP